MKAKAQLSVTLQFCHLYIVFCGSFWKPQWSVSLSVYLPMYLSVYYLSVYLPISTSVKGDKRCSPEVFVIPVWLGSTTGEGAAETI